MACGCGAHLQIHATAARAAAIRLSGEGGIDNQPAMPVTVYAMSSNFTYMVHFRFT